MKIITVPKKMFLDRCAERNVKPEDVSGCIVKEDGYGLVEIDIEHPDYPKPTNKSIKNVQREILKNAPTTRTISKMNEIEMAKAEQVLQNGPGTELKKLLSYMNINSTSNCSCNNKAKMMNERGVEWCKENKEIIIDWMEEEAKKRKLPFLRYGAKKILDLAIYRAEKQKKKN